jgi:hypothetical protein
LKSDSIDPESSRWDPFDKLRLEFDRFSSDRSDSSNEGGGSSRGDFKNQLEVKQKVDDEDSDDEETNVE